jgi:glutathione S-transferase
VGEVASAGAGRNGYPNLAAWVTRFQARPAYRKALERGGPYAYGR